MLAELTTINIADLEGNKLDASSSDGKKRQFNSEDGPEVMIVTPCSKENWMEEKTKRSKKFRVEWMNEVYFKDWLQPHPTDETYCICAACDIKLRCGKSELEKHASGLKHCKRMEAMKNDPHFKSRSSSSYSQSGDRILCEENGTFYIAPVGEHEERMDTFGLNSSIHEHSSSISDRTLSRALLKLSELMDNNSEIAKKKLEMAEAEHQCRMQILSKELQLKTLEVQLKQAELQRLNLEHQGKVIVIQKSTANHQAESS